MSLLDAENGNELATVSDNTRIKLPDFFSENVDLWFWQVESAFTAASIKADAKKYHAIIGQLPAQVILKLADFRTNPPAQNEMYNTLKKRIIQEYADSEQTKITKLLEDMPLGDRKPSQLLSDMRAKASNTAVNDNLLRQLWMRNLPETIRAILSTDDATPLSEKAATADRVLEAMRNGLLLPSKSINEAQSNLVFTNQSSPNANNLLDQLTAAVNTLTSEVKQLHISRSKTRSNTPVPNKNREKSNNGQKREQKFDFCWWHHKFGSEARRCKSPCKFNEQKN